MDTTPTYSAFAGHRRIAGGEMSTMLRATRDYIDRCHPEDLLIFEDQTGRQIDIDFRGSIDDVLARAAKSDTQRARPGRPRLGVVCREVSLLPRHWDWLESQPNGASAALRRLVDEARKRDPEGERAREAVTATSRFMSAMAGNMPGFEEASRALFTHDGARFADLISAWPGDIRAQLHRMAGPWFESKSGSTPAT